MILKEDLLRIARLNSIRAFQQEKHYIQTIALRSIYASTNDLAFKGGTCMWFFHGLNRFSEDLDFTLVAKKRELKYLPIELKKDLAVYGIDSEIRILKDDGISFSFRIGAKGPLYTKEIERCFVRIEINLVNEKLKYYTRVFGKDVFMERIKRAGEYWEPELKPLVVGRLPRFELVYNEVKAVLKDLI